MYHFQVNFILNQNNYICKLFCLLFVSQLSLSDCDVLTAYCNNKHYSYKITVDFLIKLITADNSYKHHLVHVQCRCSSSSIGTAVGATKGWPVLFILLPTMVKQTFNHLLTQEKLDGTHVFLNFILKRVLRCLLVRTINSAGFIPNKSRKYL